MQQFELDFTAGLIDRFPTFQDCVRASVYGCGRQFKAIAADLDMSPSLPSQKLAGQETVFPLQRLPELIQATGDNTPIFWLVEKFCEDSDAKHKRNVERLAQLLPEIQRIVTAGR